MNCGKNAHCTQGVVVVVRSCTCRMSCWILNLLLDTDIDNALKNSVCHHVQFLRRNQKLSETLVLPLADLVDLIVQCASITNLENSLVSPALTPT